MHKYNNTLLLSSLTQINALMKGFCSLCGSALYINISKCL